MKSDLALLGCATSFLYWMVVGFFMFMPLMADCFPTEALPCPTDSERNGMVLAAFGKGAAGYLAIAIVCWAWKRWTDRNSN